MLFAAALVFTACPNNAGGSGSGGGGTPPTPPPKHAVTFSVEGGNGTIKATVGGTEINSGDAVEQGTIVEFTATADDPATHNVDFWTVSAGTFETGTGVSGSPIAKIKVVQPVTVTVKFKPVGTPPTKYNVTFGVSGTGGTLKAEVEGVEISSPYQAERNKTVVFTATPANEYYAVEKWTDGGTDIAAAGAHATYTHTVTADANIAVHFKTAPVDVYVTGTSDNKPYVWKNDAPTQLSAHEAAPDEVAPYAVHAQGKDVYIAGEEIKQGVARPLVWEKDGSLHWISAERWSRAYDIAFYNGKTLVAGETSDGTDSGASITDISDTANPAVTFLYKKTPPISHAEAVALCVGSGTLYAAGNKYNSNTYKYTVFLWTKPDEGSVSEMELGPQGEADYSYDVCTAGASVYVAAGRLWKVDGETVTQITVPESKGGYALCVHDGTVYAAGWTNTGRAAVWKIEGTSASLYKELSTVSGGVYALCAAGGDLYAAGFYLDTDYKNKPVWWHIATGGTVTEHKLGTEKGEARGICVTPQE
ncbi:hypothetical protein [Treponema socranskii]|uniref:hypothetical protein n=1 Tax=Treponema socranskii TaxID=53419 RepID=UPI003D9101ED